MKSATTLQKTIIIVMAFITLNTEAQPWLEDPYLKNDQRKESAALYNFYDIQNAFRSYESEHTQVVNGELKKFQGYKAFKRWEYSIEPKVYPSGDLSLPGKMMHQYLEELKTQESQKSTVNSAAASISGNWAPMGPYNSNNISYWRGLGRLAALRFDPTNSNIMWACSPLGGLWKSTNAGLNWTVANTDVNAQIGCTDVTIDPTNTNNMYIATGDADGTGSQLAASSLGVLKSVNGGLTWSPTVLSWTNNLNKTIYKLLINKNNPQIILAATDNGIYRTTNAGTTSWTLVPTTNGYNFNDMEFNPLNPNTIYATSGVLSGGRLHKSTDGGVTWSILTVGLPASASIRRCAVAVTPQDTSKVYFLASNPGQTFQGFYVSVNGGASFSLRASSPDILASSAGLGQAWYDIALAVSPMDSTKIIVGGMRLFRSVNGGYNWTLNGSDNNAVAPFVHTDHHDIQFIPGSNSSYISVNDGGLWKTINDGATWTTIDNGFQTSQMYRMGTSKINPTTIMTGLQDNGNHFLKGGVWSLFAVNTGDAMECIFGKYKDSIMFLSSYTGKVIRTLNHGGSFTTVVSNTAAAGVHAASSWVTPNIQHPKLDSTYLVGKSQVYRTNDMGATWNQVGVLAGGSVNVLDLAYGPSNPNYIYASKSNKFYVSTDGTTFADRTGTLPVGLAALTTIAVSNTDPSKVWVAMSGYSAGNKVYFSPDAGLTWINYSTGLPNLPVNSILYHNNSSNGIYAGTDAGVYFRSDSLASWQPFKNNLPNVDIEEMEIAYSLNKIRAVTNGRGLWESDLALPTAAFINASSICAQSAITFTDVSVGSPTEWLWSFTGGAPATSTLQNPATTYSVGGVYTVTLKAGDSNGTTIITKTITVNPSPTVSVSSGSICSGQSFTMIPGGAVSYTYSGGSAIVSPSANATYSVTGTNTFGCISNIAISNVTVNPAPVITVNSSAICTGQSFTMTPGGANTYTYSSGTAVVSPTTNTSYNVTGTSSLGCVSTAPAISSVTVNPLPVLSTTTTSSLLCVGQTATLSVSGASTYTWSTSGTGSSIVVNPAVTTNYSVNGTDANGCLGVTSLTQSVSACTGLNNLFDSAEGISVYPSPSKGLINVWLDNFNGKPVQIQILNAAGQILLSENVHQKQTQFNIENFSAGIYFVKVLQQEKQTVVRLIKE